MSEEDYQIGVHDIDTSGTITDEDGVKEFEFEAEAVFKRLADDVYETAEAGIREPLMNSITAVRKAFGEDNLDNGIIKFTVKRGERPTVRIRDNGIGITQDVLDDVLMVIGRSSVRDDGKLTGQYGMGFLASYKLVGPEGGFLMTTNPRNSQEGSYSGLFRPGAFEENTEGHLPQMLDDNEYGTVFEYHLKKGISTNDIFEWVEKHARWSPVPVIYEELDRNGKEIRNEDFYTGELSDRYGDSPYVSYEDKFFEIATSPDATGETVLISSPMNMNDSEKLSNHLSSWDVDVRLKYENGIVIRGDNQGLAPVNKSEYSSMSSRRQEKYIPRGELLSGDITLPSPIGTREKLESNDDFIEYANEKIRKEFRKVLDNVVTSFDPESDEFDNLNRQEQHCLSYFAELFRDDTYVRFLDYTPSAKLHLDSKKKKIASKLTDVTSSNFDSDDKIVEFIDMIGTKVSTETTNGEKDRKHVHNVVNMSDHIDKIYMCVSKGTWKYDAVKESGFQALIVSIKSSDMYEPLSEHFGWTPLKTIDVDEAKSNLGLSESQIEDMRGVTTSSKPVEDKEVTIHKRRGTKNFIASKVKSGFGKRILDNKQILVLFPRGFDENLTDNRTLAKGRVSIASCSKDMKEYLTKKDNIVTYKDYADWALKMRIMTNEGEMTIEDFLDSDKNSILYLRKIVGPSVQDKKVLSSFAKGLKVTENLGDEILIGISKEDVLEHLIKCSKFTSIGLKEKDFKTISRRRRRSIPDRVNHQTVSIDEVDMYLKSELNTDVYRSDVSDSLQEQFEGVDKNLVSLVESINESYKIGGLNTREKTAGSLPVHKTHDGSMTIKEIYANYNPDDVVLNILDSDIIGYFENDDFLEKASKEIGNVRFENGIVTTGRIPGDKIYVPVTSSDLKEISYHIKSGTNIIVGVNNTRRNRYARRSNRGTNISVQSSVTAFNADVRMIYGSVILNNWTKKSVARLVKQSSFEHSKTLVDSLENIHDEGRSCPVK